MMKIHLVYKYIGFLPLKWPFIVHDIDGVGLPLATHFILATSFSKMLISLVVSLSEITGGETTRRYAT